VTIARTLLAGALLLTLSSCGAANTASSGRPHTASVPAYVVEPFSHEQQLVEQGARLVVSDGCAACHLSAQGKAIAPSFASFAGHRVELTGGRTVLVEERFLREGLLNPGRTVIKGYAAAPMRAAVQRLHLSAHPQQVAALAAFIEQVGPEAE
jgi:cytochrome c oxidase subunit II